MRRGDPRIGAGCPRRGRHGIDAEPAMLEVARQPATAGGVRATFVEAHLERPPFPDATFDLVVASIVLCFVPEARDALRDMARVARPGGRLVSGELGVTSTWAVLRRLGGRWGTTTWRRARFRTGPELRALAERAGKGRVLRDPALPVGVRPAGADWWGGVGSGAASVGGRGAREALAAQLMVCPVDPLGWRPRTTPRPPRWRGPGDVAGG